MDFLLQKLKYISIGIITTSILMIVCLVMFILGLQKVFYTRFDPSFDTIDDLFVVQNLPGTYSSRISDVIWMFSISFFSLLFVFWWIQTIFSLKICKELQKNLCDILGNFNLSFYRTNFLNLVTFCFGSILILSTCNEILDYSKLKKIQKQE